jgi:hypothetical protein
VFGHHQEGIEHLFPSSVPDGTIGRGGRRMRARLLAVVLVVAGLLVVVPGLARGDGPDRPAPRVTYVVEAGDTPWSIAQRVAPGHDPRPVVDALIEANDLRGGLQTGQELSIPVPER